MNRFGIIVFALLPFCACQRPRTLPESLGAIFADHLQRIDSATILDSLHVQWTVPVTARMATVFNDSIYVREYTRIKGQLAGALVMGNKDSIDFYEYEIHYMEKEIDSISHGIGESDTIHRYGTLVGCAYYVSKYKKSAMDSTVLFIDTTSTVRFTDFMDSSLRRTVKLLR
ncbi:MAG TPA: hypothetical protein VMH27_00125 [Puia sp.]|nr:hypothetical protein [Puia sp.]